MRVRGWYWPATMSLSRNEAGKPVLLASLPLSNTFDDSPMVGPSKACNPRPRPLGFLVTMLVCLSGFEISMFEKAVQVRVGT